MTPSLAICIPNYGDVKEGFLDASNAQMHSLGIDGFDRVVVLRASSSQGAYNARNRIFENLEFVEKQGGFRYEWTVWFDSDMIFPSRTIQALIRHDVDIVGATYKRRSAPYEMMGRPLSGASPDIKVGELAPFERLPTGCLLIRRSVFDSIKRPVWKIKQGATYREDVSEDNLFCEEAIACGYKIWLDTTLTTMISHIADVPLGADVDQAPSGVILPKSNGRIIHAGAI